MTARFVIRHPGSEPLRKMHSDLIRQEKNMGTVYLETFAKIAEMNDDPKKFYEQFGMSHSGDQGTCSACASVGLPSVVGRRVGSPRLRHPPCGHPAAASTRSESSEKYCLDWRGLPGGVPCREAVRLTARSESCEKTWGFFFRNRSRLL